MYSDIRSFWALFAPPILSVLGGTGPPQGVSFVGAPKMGFLTIYANLERLVAYLHGIFLHYLHGAHGCTFGTLLCNLVI